VTGRSGEVRLLAAMSVFGIAVGTVYWFLTYETVGTLLLVGFGIAAGVGAAMIVEREHGRPGMPRPGAIPIPRPGWAPIAIGFGLGGVALGAVFGPWLGIGGLLLALAGGWIWLASAMTEADPRRETRQDD
jgi:membrane associated rhomboid family serine protease